MHYVRSYTSIGLLFLITACGSPHAVPSSQAKKINYDIDNFVYVANHATTKRPCGIIVEKSRGADYDIQVESSNKGKIEMNADFRMRGNCGAL
jgi:hypothetical protein